jgi:hypothetical protein
MKSYQHQRASSSGGIYKLRHTLWRDHTLARWLRPRIVCQPASFQSGCDFDAGVVRVFRDGNS